MNGEQPGNERLDDAPLEARGREAPPPPGEPVARPGCLHYGLFFLASVWVLLVTCAVQATGWVVGQALLIQEEQAPAVLWPLVTWLQGLLLLLPLVPLSRLTEPPRLRAAYRTWGLAAAFLWPLGLIRLIPEMRTEAAALAQGLLALAALAIAVRLARRRGHPVSIPGRGRFPLPLALAPLVAAPWIALGALGSPLDVLLAVFAGLAFGAFAAVLLDAFLLRPLASSPGRDVLFGGFVAGSALAVLGSGFGFAGNQLLLMAALPPLGFALAAVGRTSDETSRRAGAGWVPAAVLLAPAAGAVLGFFDPKELTFLLDQGGERDILTWAAAASGATVLLALVAGLLASVVSRRPAWRDDRGSPLPAAGAWIALAALYLVAGQPGFFGDGLFVVLRDQADLSTAASISDRDQRAGFVYQTLTRHADASQAGIRADLDRLRIPYRPYYLVNGIEVDGGPLVRLYLSRRPEVDRVLDSPRLRPLPEPVPRARGDEGAPASPRWNITSIGADRVWSELGVTGKGIVVGQSDSGVEGTHPALSGSYRGRLSGDAYNWLDPWNHTPSPTDSGGHGTHTLGSVLGSGGIGVAPDAEWFACVNLDRNLGNPGLYLDCMQFMLAPYPQGSDPFVQGDPGKGAHVTNNSWGCPEVEGCDASALLPAARALRAAGIFAAVSAGNSGPRCESLLDPLAIYPQVFTVGAIDSGGDIAWFSSRGPVNVDGSGRVKPDIAAPGVDVISSFPQGTYRSLDGTSMAGPHVAGVVALMWSAQPKLIGDIDRTEQLLRDTARPYVGKREGCFQGGRPSDAYGYGVLDAYAAVKAAQALK